MLTSSSDHVLGCSLHSSMTHRRVLLLPIVLLLAQTPGLLALGNCRHDLAGISYGGAEIDGGSITASSWEGCSEHCASFDPCRWISFDEKSKSCKPVCLAAHIPCAWRFPGVASRVREQHAEWVFMRDRRPARATRRICVRAVWPGRARR